MAVEAQVGEEELAWLKLNDKGLISNYLVTSTDITLSLFFPAMFPPLDYSLRCPKPYPA